MKDDGVVSPLASLGIDLEQMPSLPDETWLNALEVALDPATDLIDESLVPDIDDIPNVVDDDVLAMEDIVDLDGDLDGTVLGGNDLELSEGTDFELDIPSFEAPSLEGFESERADFEVEAFEIPEFGNDVSDGY